MTQTAVTNAVADQAAIAERQRIIKVIADNWTARAKCQHWKKGTKAYQKNQIEFVIGAYAALTAVGGTDIGMIAALICVGRDINDFVKETT